MSLHEPPNWTAPSGDANDTQFGDIVEPTTLLEAGDYDAVLVGEPYDGAVIGRRGAAKAPDVIRESLARAKAHHYETGPVSSVGDLGDVQVPNGEVKAVQNAIVNMTRKVHAADTFPVFIGGDNSLTVPNVQPLLERSAENVGVVSIDAHLDCREPTDSPTSGTPYRQLFDAGLDALSVVGARHFETSTAYADFLADRDGTVFTPTDVWADPAGIADAAIAALGDVDRVYVSLDMDVLDQVAAPGVSAPTPGGIRTLELYALLGRIVTESRVTGFEVVECAPPLDRDGRTVRATARSVAHVLAGVTASE